MYKISSVIVTLLSVSHISNALTKIHMVYWNTTNPIFRIDNTDHIVDVNDGNLPWEYDQLNLICPHNSLEQHVIYSVSKEEFDNCRVTNPRPKIVAICNKPQEFMYFTITFRSFTPTPGGLEFRPGQEYYFISTANTRDIHRRVGGWCKSHNMKMIVKVAESQTELKFRENQQKSTTFSPIPSPAAFWSKFQTKSKNMLSEHYQQSEGETYFSDNSSTMLDFRDESVDISISGRSHSSAASVPTLSIFYLLLFVSLSWLLSEQRL